MSYHALAGVALGAEEKSASADIAKKCTANIKSAQLDTKAGREQAVSTTAECAADGACAVYSQGAIPPGVCGPIAKAVAGEAIKIWNSIFGDDAEQRRALQRRADVATYFSALKALSDVELVMNIELAAAAKGLIDYHDRLIPSRKGAYGGKQPYSQGFYLQTSISAEGGLPTKSLTKAGYNDDARARQLLAAQGMQHRVGYGGNISPPSPTVVNIQTGAANAWAQAEIQRRRAGCAQTDVACFLRIPNATVLATEWIKQQMAAVPIAFYASLDAAMLRARAVIAAEAAAEAGRLKAQAAAHTSVHTESGAAKAGAVLLVAGALAAAIVIWRR